MYNLQDNIEYLLSEQLPHAQDHEDSRIETSLLSALSTTSGPLALYSVAWTEHLRLKCVGYAWPRIASFHQHQIKIGKLLMCSVNGLFSIWDNWQYGFYYLPVVEVLGHHKLKVSWKDRSGEGTLPKSLFEPLW